MNDFKCRFCGSKVNTVFSDLGLTPLANEYVSRENMKYGQRFFPLKVYTCENCYYTQTMEVESPESIFAEYLYYSSYSSSWVDHARKYCDMISDRLHLTSESMVAEVACNDGYLLQFFKGKGIPCYGVEPGGKVAEEAEKKGIEVYHDFFNEFTANKLVEEGKQVDLLIGNNVLAHVPDINSFIKGIKAILKPKAIATFEFPHLMQLMMQNQFDTIYHEHFSYLSLLFLKRAMESNGLVIVDVEELQTHGGSLRIYLAHENAGMEISSAVEKIANREKEYGLNSISTYSSFDGKIKTLKRDILERLVSIKNEGFSVAAYGAAAKGNTLLNYCGIGKDFIDYVADANPHKQGLYLPGTYIPIVDIDYMNANVPDYLIILPWNIKEEIINDNKIKKPRKGFITLIPEPMIK